MTAHHLIGVIGLGLNAFGLGLAAGLPGAARAGFTGPWRFRFALSSLILGFVLEALYLIES